MTKSVIGPLPSDTTKEPSSCNDTKGRGEPRDIEPWRTQRAKSVQYVGFQLLRIPYIQEIKVSDVDYAGPELRVISKIKIKSQVINSQLDKI